jgi:hypothetical protein
LSEGVTALRPRPEDGDERRGRRECIPGEPGGRPGRHWRHMRHPIGPALLLAVLLAACAAPASSAADGDPPPATSSDAAPVLIVSDGSGSGDDPGISVAEALGHRASDDLVVVTGALFVDRDGVALLCDAIAESFPPQCGGDRIEVQGLDLDGVPGLQEEGGVRWAEAVSVPGSVE